MLEIVEKSELGNERKGNRKRFSKYIVFHCLRTKGNVILQIILEKPNSKN